MENKTDKDLGKVFIVAFFPVIVNLGATLAGIELAKRTGYSVEQMLLAELFGFFGLGFIASEWSRRTRIRARRYLNSPADSSRN